MPLTVRFTTSAIGGTGSYEYRWQFGDGSSSTDRNPSHTYSRVGNFTANVNVTSGSQARECERSISVVMRPEEPEYFKPGYVRRVTWTSELTVAGARGQVVVNGMWMTYPGEGRAHGVLDLPSPAYTPYGADVRTVRVEATLVEAAGRPGAWRFDLDAAETFALVEPGSIRVVSGEALQVAATSVVFRLRGKPGERVVFTFQAR